MGWRRFVVKRRSFVVKREQSLCTASTFIVECDGEKLELSAPRLPYAKTRKEALGGPKTKYLDGQQVSTKGSEKFVVVETKEEWEKIPDPTGGPPQLAGAWYTPMPPPPPEYGWSQVGWSHVGWSY